MGDITVYYGYIWVKRGDITVCYGYIWLEGWILLYIMDEYGLNGGYYCILWIHMG